MQICLKKCAIACGAIACGAIACGAGGMRRRGHASYGAIGAIGDDR